MDRNCQGKYQPIAMRVGDDIYDRCPISLLDTKACEVIAVLEACEGGGLGGGMTLPSQFLEETQYFHNVRQIVLHEKWRMGKKKKDVRESP